MQCDRRPCLHRLSALAAGTCSPYELPNAPMRELHASTGSLRDVPTVRGQICATWRSRRLESADLGAAAGLVGAAAGGLVAGSVVLAVVLARVASQVRAQLVEHVRGQGALELALVALELLDR